MHNLIWVWRTSSDLYELRELKDDELEFYIMGWDIPERIKKTEVLAYVEIVDPFKRTTNDPR